MWLNELLSLLTSIKLSVKPFMLDEIDNGQTDAVHDVFAKTFPHQTAKAYLT